MNVKVVAAKGHSNIAIQKGDSFWIRTPDRPDQSLDWSGDPDTMIAALVTKWDYLPVVGKDGKTHPEMPEDHYPLLSKKPITLDDGSEAWTVAKFLSPPEEPPVPEDTRFVVDPKELTANAFCPTGPGGGVDPSCSAGSSGGSIREATQTRAREILDEGQRNATGKIAESVPLKVIKAGASVIGNTLKAVYNRYGDKGSIATFVVAHAAFAATTALTGGASLIPAVAFGLAAVEARKGMGALVGWMSGDPIDRAEGTRMVTGNAEDADDLARMTLDLIERFAKAAGVPVPEVSLDEVKARLKREMGE